MKKLLLTILVFGLAIELAQAQIHIGTQTTVTFATMAEAKEILTNRDDYIQSLSPFDRSSRMKTDRDISEKEYLEFLGNNVLDWNTIEKQKITSAFESVKKSLEDYSWLLPKNIILIKTSGNEEGGAPYTRSNAIIFPKTDLAAPLPKIQQTISHELFHIISRVNPELRDKLYAAIGFVKCDEMEFPAELKSRKITNPDAPQNNHCIRVQFQGNTYWAIPILFSDSEKYNISRGGEFFDYLQFQFLLVERPNNSSTVKPIYENQKPKLVEIRQISGFFEQIGKNTEYIIHPEEIIADNFMFLILGEQNIPSPVIIKKIEKILKGK
jgi:hypothetical protein